MSLQFNVSQLLRSGVGSARSYDFEADEPIDLGDNLADEIQGHVKFTLTNFGILANVEAQARISLACARCLDPFFSKVTVEFVEEFEPSINIETGLPVAETHTENAFFITANHQIDLTEALRQHLLLAVEIVPVCRTDCKGLCPTCGVNLNMETCECPPPEPASPFAALQGLIVDPQSG